MGAPGYFEAVTVTEWILLALALLVVLGLVGFFAMRSSTGWGAASGGRTGPARPPREHFGDGETVEKPRPRAAVIVNPTKFDDVDAVRAQVRRGCEAAGWAEPLWLETTQDDPGAGQTRQALEAGVDVICPLGGDGTVRTVGDALKGSATPMGLLPGGTGNLLARNLDLPVESIDKCLQIALTGRNKRIDVGSMTVPGEEPYTFLVMAGMGFDADIMAGTDEDLKARMGWPAYVVSGAQHLVGPRFKARVSTDDETFTRRTRSVIIGNVGKLQGGMTLMPDAVVDDGLLDALVLSPRGVVGWAAVAARLASGRRKGHELVTHHATSHLSVTADQPVQLQIDGDPIDKATEVSFDVEHLALVVRVPAVTTGGSSVLMERVEAARAAVRERRTPR